MSMGAGMAAAAYVVVVVVLLPGMKPRCNDLAIVSESGVRQSVQKRGLRNKAGQVKEALLLTGAAVGRKRASGDGMSLLDDNVGGG
jgi:hypothetical protein